MGKTTFWVIAEFLASGREGCLLVSVLADEKDRNGPTAVLFLRWDRQECLSYCCLVSRVGQTGMSVLLLSCFPGGTDRNVCPTAVLFPRWDRQECLSYLARSFPIRMRRRIFPAGL